jgi:NADH-quinone oxidoreductase subunit C
MNNLKLVKKIVQDTISVLKIEEVDKQQLAFEINKEDIHLILSTLKSAGWKQLSYFSAVDWPEENKFELVYILFNWDKPVYIQLRSKIDRDNPVLNTVMPIFPGVKYYEREAHEFFGIHFPGNPDYQKQLILENWDDIPPLRKDFIPKVYSDKLFTDRVYPTDFSVKDPKNHHKEKHDKRDKRADSLRKGGKKQ